MMNNAKKIYNIGEWIMVLGSLIYLIELLTQEQFNLTLPISIIYIISVVMIVIGFIGTKDERKAEKARLKAEKAQKA